MCILRTKLSNSECFEWLYMSCLRCVVACYREEDHDKSDDEDERIDFSSNKDDIEKQKHRDNFLAVEHGM